MFYFLHASSVCILIWLLVEYINIVIRTASRSVMLIKGEVLIRGSGLFQCGYPKEQHLLKGSNYLKVWLLVEYSNYSNKLLIGKHGAYLRGVLIWMWIPKGVALTRRQHLLEEIWYILLRLAQLYFYCTFYYTFETTLFFIPCPAKICAFQRLEQKIIKSVGRYLVWSSMSYLIQNFCNPNFFYKRQNYNYYVCIIQ